MVVVAWDKRQYVLAACQFERVEDVRAAKRFMQDLGLDLARIIVNDVIGA